MIKELVEKIELMKTLNTEIVQLVCSLDDKNLFEFAECKDLLRETYTIRQSLNKQSEVLTAKEVSV